MRAKISMTLAAITAGAMLVGSVGQALAVDGRSTLGSTQVQSPLGSTGTTIREQVREQVKNKLVERARKRGLEAIDRRVRALERELERVRMMARLSEEDRNYLVNEIQNALDGLSSLRGKIEIETNVDALRAEIKSIVNDYRVYAVGVPKGLALMAADKANWGVQRFDHLAQRVQERIDKAKAAGKDVTAVQGLLDQLNAKLDDAKTQIDNARDAFKSMLPVDPGNARNSLQLGKEYLKTARQDFKDAIALMRQIIAAFKETKVPTLEESPTAN